MAQDSQQTSSYNFLRRVFEPGDLIEIRGIGSKKFGPMRVLTRDLAYAAREAANMVTLGSNVYYLLNPIAPDSRYATKSPHDDLCFSSYAARDEDIACRNLYMIDCDPVRESGTAASEEQRQEAMELAGKVRAYLRERQWPEPIVLDSGNGVHLLYKGDRCSADESELKIALKHLNREVGTPAVKIDTVVCNPARLARLPREPQGRTHGAGRGVSTVLRPTARVQDQSPGRGGWPAGQLRHSP